MAYGERIGSHLMNALHFCTVELFSQAGQRIKEVI